METVPLPIFFDNPILVKHLRSRLRPNAAAGWMGCIALVCIAIVWGNYYAYGGLGLGYELQWLLALQVYLLGMQGAIQASLSVGESRASGIFEYHRLSPLPPSWIGLGFLLGGPIREWLLWAVTLPFAFLAARGASIGVGGFLAFEIPLVLGSMVLQALAVLVVLISRKPKGNTQGSSFGIAVVGIAFGWPITQLMNLLVTFLCDPEETRKFSFYGIPIHWLAFLIFYQGCALGFAILAVIRKSTSDRTHALSKPQAVACMATAAVLAVGAIWGYRDEKYAAVGLLYGLVFWSAFQVATVAVDRSEYVRGLKRAWARGRRRPKPWEPDASGQWAVYAIAAVVAIAGSVAWERLLGTGRPASSVTVALAAFTTAELGLGFQYARLRAGKYGGFLFTLFVILAWLLPLGAAGTLAGAGAEDSTVRIAAAISPLAGLELTADPSWTVGPRNLPIPGSPEIVSGDIIRFAAILPTLFFASLFNLLLVLYQRKIDRVVRHSLAKAKAPEELAASG